MEKVARPVILTDNDYFCTFSRTDENCRDWLFSAKYDKTATKCKKAGNIVIITAPSERGAY